MALQPLHSGVLVALPQGCRVKLASSLVLTTHICVTVDILINLSVPHFKWDPNPLLSRCGCEDELRGMCSCRTTHFQLLPFRAVGLWARYLEALFRSFPYCKMR